MIRVTFVRSDIGIIVHVQWSLHFKTTHLARKNGLKLKVVLKWKGI